jgi:hypothetical protein
MAKGDWPACTFLVSNDEKGMLALSLIEHVPEAKRAELIAIALSDSNAPWARRKIRETFMQLFAYLPEGDPPVVISEERAWSPPAGKRVKLYRGVVADSLRKAFSFARGFSWTADQKIAVWFAREHGPAWYGNGRSWVAETSVRLSSIVLWNDSRQEAEAVLRPAALRKLKIRLEEV